LRELQTWCDSARDGVQSQARTAAATENSRAAIVVNKKRRKTSKDIDFDAFGAVLAEFSSIASIRDFALTPEVSMSPRSSTPSTGFLCNASLRRIFATGALIALGALSACGDGASGNETYFDASSPSLTQPVFDAGAPVVDSSTPPAPVDSGSVVVVPPKDSGPAITLDATVAADAGPVADGGSADAAQDDGGAVPAGAIQRGPADKDFISKKGPYATMSYTSGFMKGSAFGAGTVYYPTAADAKPPFAYVAICPGFSATQSSIGSWGPFLASHGIVAMTIDTNDVLDDMPTRAKELKAAIASIAGENTRMGSPLVGKLDLARKGSMGWSMGGGGTLDLAEQDSSLKAAVSLCGYEPGHNYSKVTVPSLLFTATGDTVATPSQNALAWYPQMMQKKMLFQVQGGSHSSANSPTGTNGQIGAYGLGWLKVFLEGDERFIPILKMMPTGGVAMFQTNL
jgi:dienelactone hydrolase